MTDCPCCYHSCGMTVDPEDPDDNWHHDRTCLYCKREWRGLHCPHDGIQNPCPSCDKRPAPVPDPVCVDPFDSD